jgi:tetratricopeptide (TPR) repeat protein
LTEIGHARLDEFDETGDERILAAAVAAYERALEVLPPGEEQWTFLSNLGNALREVYEASRDRTALDRAADLLERALYGLSSEDADRAVVLDNLALVLRDRYGDLGYLDELRKAAELHEDALAAYGDGPERVRYLNNLGGALWELYGATGDAALLEPAPSAFEAAVAVAPTRSPAPACTCRTSPAPSSAPTGTRAERRCSVAHLTSLGRPLTWRHAPDRGRQLSTLAQLLMERYHLAGDLDEVLSPNDAITFTMPVTRERSCAGHPTPHRGRHA